MQPSALSRDLYRPYNIQLSIVYIIEPSSKLSSISLILVASFSRYVSSEFLRSKSISPFPGFKCCKICCTNTFSSAVYLRKVARHERETLAGCDDDCERIEIANSSRSIFEGIASLFYHLTHDSTFADFATTIGSVIHRILKAVSSLSLVLSYSICVRYKSRKRTSSTISSDPPPSVSLRRLALRFTSYTICEIKFPLMFAIQFNWDMET